MLTLAQKVMASLTPAIAAMARALDGGHDLIHAEALSFELAEWMPRPEAQTAVKGMCAEANATDTSLFNLQHSAFRTSAGRTVWPPPARGNRQRKPSPLQRAYTATDHRKGYGERHPANLAGLCQNTSSRRLPSVRRIEHLVTFPRSLGCRQVVVATAAEVPDPVSGRSIVLDDDVWRQAGHPVCLN